MISNILRCDRIRHLYLICENLFAFKILNQIIIGTLDKVYFNNISAKNYSIHYITQSKNI